MSAPIISFFNNKGGVGKTSLVYHLAWMYAEQGKHIVAVDLDPQSNLSSFFLSEDDLENLWENHDQPNTIYRCIQPLIKGTGDILSPQLQEIEINGVTVALLAGDLALSQFEDDLATVWPECADGRERAFRVISSFWRIIQLAVDDYAADLVLVDMGPNLGSINRAVMISTDSLVIPLASDLFSVQGLRNLGPTLSKWRKQWQERRPKNPADKLKIPEGHMTPLGYIAMLHAERESRPTLAYQKWLARIPQVYQTEILHQTETVAISLEQDPNRLGTLKHYRSLMPMAQDARKPIFFLKTADGVVGAHFYSVQSAYQDFKTLSEDIFARLSNVAEYA
jgi:cellulose biosynthesis protein BcsQ